MVERQERLDSTTFLQIPFFDMQAYLQRDHFLYQEALEAVLSQHQIVNGPATQQFEAAWATYNDAKFAVAVSTGFEAIRLSLLAAELPPHSIVACPAFTCPATALAIEAAGFTIQFVDVEADTGLLDLGHLEQLLKTGTIKAVVLVNLFGQCVNYKALGLLLATYPELVIVEDNAQGHGLQAGQVALKGYPYFISATSFYPTKNLGALGEAGAITTDRADWQRKLLALRDYGTTAKRFESTLVSGNYRMDELQAAILLQKLPNLNAENEARRNNQLAVRQVAASNQALHFLPAQQGWNGHLFVCRVAARDNFIDYLNKKGVGTMIHYPMPLHLLPALAHYDLSTGTYPVAEQWANEVVSLPGHALLGPAECAYLGQVLLGWNP